MTAYGVTPQGFVIPTAAEILADIEADQKGKLGDDLDVSPEQPLGQLNGIFAAKLRTVWEAALAAYAARDPNGASFQTLTNVAALTGTVRRGQRPGQVQLAVTLDNGTTLAAGAIAGVTGQPTNQWKTIAAAGNTSGGPVAVEVTAVQVNPGPIPGGTWTINQIVTPVTGWTAVSNLSAPLPGTDVETDVELRPRRDAELQSAGSTPLDALRAALAELPLVTEVVCWENAGSAVDTDGRPPHSVEAMVTGGDPGAIALAIWAGKAGGIEPFGTESPIAIIDAQGALRSVRFSRPEALPLYVRVTAEVDPATDPGDAAIQAAIVAAYATLPTGATVRRMAAESAVFRVPGVRDVRSLTIGTTLGGAIAANLVPHTRQRAAFDASRIEVTRVPG